MHMVDLMSSIICEGDTVSQELLDTVLVNLVPAHKVRFTGLCFVIFFVCFFFFFLNHDFLDVCIQLYRSN